MMAGVMVIALIIVWSTTHGLGRLGDLLGQLGHGLLGDRLARACAALLLLVALVGVVSLSKDVPEGQA